MEDDKYYIYSITCKATKGCYVGRTKDYVGRIRRHFSDLKRGVHCSDHMQQDFELYGESSFESKIETTFKGKNFIWEQKVWDIKSKDHIMYNYRPQVNGVPEIIRDDLVKDWCGKRIWVTNGEKDYYLKEGETLPNGYRLGRSKGVEKPNEETRKKMSESHIGDKNGFFGKRHTEEYKKKKSDLQKERLSDPQNHPMFGKQQSPEAKFKSSISIQARNKQKKNNLNIDVIKCVLEAQTIFGKNKVYAVGGCVRDMLLNKDSSFFKEHPISIKDIDLCTELLPDEVEEILKRNNYHIWTVGKRFGTLSYKSKIVPYIVEITTYRSEHYKDGSRKPDVEFGTSLREDLLRRDFTINAMAFDGERVIDLFAGRLDLDDHLIKSVGDPKKMLSDDPLRILRAVRFACKYNFNIEPNLLGCCKKGHEKLWTVAIERQVVELDKIFTSDNASRGLELLKHIEVLDMLLPELVKYDFPLHGEDADWAWRNLLHYVGGYEKFDDWGSDHYVYDKNKHDFLCKGICARFKFSNKRTNIILGGKYEQ